jgi:hypothetical protein
MNRLLMIAVAVSVLALPAPAQRDFPRAEAFAGYQFVHLNPSLNASGWNAAVNGNVNRWFGITADFSGVYKHGGAISSMKQSLYIAEMVRGFIDPPVQGGACDAIWLHTATRTSRDR